MRNIINCHFQYLLGLERVDQQCHMYKSFVYRQSVSCQQIPLRRSAAEVSPALNEITDCSRILATTFSRYIPSLLVEHY